MNEEVLFHVNSIFNSVCYRVGSILIDPGDTWDGFYGVTMVLLTHVHFDHIYGLNNVINSNPEAKVFTNESGANALINPKLNLSKYHDYPFVFSYPNNIVLAKDRIPVSHNGKSNILPFFTPGHNASCITWLYDNLLFTGDSYIPGIKTVTNLPGGDKYQAENSENLIKKFFKNSLIFPGHQI